MSDLRVNELPGDLRYAHHLLSQWGDWARSEPVVSGFASTTNGGFGKSVTYPEDWIMAIDGCICRMSHEGRKQVKSFYLKRRDTYDPTSIKKALAEFYSCWEGRDGKVSG